MSSRQVAQHAIELLELQLKELAGIRNATARDPSFKNWRQATLAVMQSIWPGDQDHCERFRRTPFSPPDPRAHVRVTREWYSRGCQEAARVLTGFIDDIRTQGVPDVSGSEPAEAQASEFEDGFPTVHLPAGDLRSSTSTSDMTDNMLADLNDTLPQGSDPLSPVPRRLRVGMSPPTTPESSTPAPETADARPAKKGLNMKARLRDLLGFAQLSAKALAGFPRETPVPTTNAPPATDARAELGVVPLGDEVGPPPPLPLPVLSQPAAPKPVWPVLHKHANAAATATPVTPASSAVPPARAQANVTRITPRTPPAAVQPPPAPPAEVRATGTESPSSPSSIMSRTTTLRGAIEKVSIESLISPAFRGMGGDEAVPPVASVPPPSVPGWPTLGPPGPAEPPAAEDDLTEVPPPPDTARPPLTLVRPVFDDPEFSAGPAPSSEFAAPGVKLPAEPPAPAPRAKHPAGHTSAPTPRIVPLPPPSARVPPPAPEAEDEMEFETETTDTPLASVDPDAFARATEGFMHTSPVLGATGRRVQRRFDDLGFGDPDAIAVGSMVQDMARMGIPAERRTEVRARLMDLARRLERGELEWSALRKAVWFAMEYPELARRLMPVLLPWIDRAA